MTEDEINDLKKYKDFPEGSAGKVMYDSIYMTFEAYLEKYYLGVDLSVWRKWIEKYINPAFDPYEHEVMIKNFGYSSLDNFNFSEQYNVYNELENEKRLDEETRRFIGFLGGAGFFKRFNLEVINWFNIPNWYHPYWKPDGQKTLNEILDFKYGLNYIKIQFIGMPFWKR